MTRIAEELAYLAEHHARFCATRQHFHQGPEIAFEEAWTRAELAARLEALGCKISGAFGGTGFVASLGGGAGPVVALRTDMDALPQTEETGLSYASRNPGRMHACGHDGHMTLMLATAELLARGPELAGTVKFICQPAEEVGRGAQAMLDDGLYDQINPAMVFGYHNWPELPLGAVQTRVGAIMAAYRQISFTLEGRGGHAALPHMSDEMYGALAAVITRANARMRAELPDTAFAFTQNLGGSAANIIPSRLEVSASLRYGDDAEGEAAGRIADEIAAEVTASFGLRVSAQSRHVFNATRNAAAAVAVVEAVVAAGARGLSYTTAPKTSMVAEDFGAFAEDRPGCYIWLGAGNARGALHNNRFDFNDALLLNAPQLMADILRRALADAAAGANV